VIEDRMRFAFVGEESYEDFRGKNISNSYLNSFIPRDDIGSSTNKHSATMSTEEELPPSKLGTKEYWDKVYEREVGVFEDTGDEGEVWFGERAMVKMRDWVYANCQPEQEEQSGENSEKRRIRVMECGCGMCLSSYGAESLLKLFTGNATLLLSLLTPPANDDDSDEENEDGNSAARPRFMPTQLTGIDYSEASIKLAQGVAERRRDMWRRRVEKARKAAAGADEETKESSQSSEDEDEDYDSDDETLSPATLQLDDPLLTSLPLFLTGDLLNFRSIRDLYSTLPESSPVKQSSEIDEPWDLVLDKGTFDALALSQETIPVPRRNQDGTEELEQRLPSAVYPEKVSELVKKGGFFLITCKDRAYNVFGSARLTAAHF
jgi:hypothetical protein